MHEQLGTFLLVTGSAFDICGEHLLLSDCDIEQRSAKDDQIASLEEGRRSPQLHD